MYHKLAAKETYQCQGRIKRVKERLRGQFIDYEFRNEDQAKQLYAESRFHFTMISTCFDVQQPSRNESREECKLEMTSLLEQHGGWDSSIDTSDDEDLLQEADNFCKNLENWFEEEEIRKEKEEARQLRKLKREAAEAAGSPARRGPGDRGDRVAGGNGSAMKRNDRSSKKEKRRKRKRDNDGSDTSDSDPSSDSDFSDSDNPEWQELRERTNGLRNMRRRTYETRQKNKDPDSVKKKTVLRHGDGLDKRAGVKPSEGSSKCPKKCLFKK